jgi:hypothetical protein
LVTGSRGGGSGRVNVTLTRPDQSQARSGRGRSLWLILIHLYSKYSPERDPQAKWVDQHDEQTPKTP